MRTLFFLIFALFCTHLTKAQTFGAELTAGFNASQIDGDGSAGYNKLGLMGGVNALIYLKEKSYASIGIFYTQRGSQNELNRNNTPTGGNNFSLRLDYIEVPILFHYRDWLASESESFYKVDVHAGLSYGRLMNSKLQDDLGAINNVISRLKENDISLIVGAGYHINKRYALQFQYRRSMTPIYKPDMTTTIIRGNWIGHLISFQGTLTF